MKYMYGDLLDLAEEGVFDAIIHGCNIFNTFGAGIALQIRELYPEAYEADKNTVFGDKDKLGTYTVWIGPHFNIYNAYTQPTVGKHTNVDYDALRDAMLSIKWASQAYPPLRFGIPMIGAGLGGGDWDIISDIIDDVGFDDITCVLYRR